jgi:hypothetical protein
MSRFPRLRRRPDQWRDAHERARGRAAERLDGPLGLTESQWLDDHLAGCEDCSAISAAYAADRQTLRALRDDHPEPPRDLWARTAAAIERLSIESGGRAPDAPSARRLSDLPLSAISAVAIVVLVVGASLLTNGIRGPVQRPGAAPESPGIAIASASSGPLLPGADATPFAVKTGKVSWIDKGSGGLAVSSVEVEQVCPEQGSANCPAIPDEPPKKLVLDGTPRTLIGSPSSQQAIAISKSPTAGDQVVIVQLPESSSATATPSPTPTRTAPTASPSDTSTESATSSETPATPTPTIVASSAPTASPIETPAATNAKALAIASGIDVVGESAAFSADGTLFAFTARSKAGAGPDVYVWHVGDAAATRLTTDGMSYFGSWSGHRAVVSRPADPTSRVSDPESVFIDPATGTEQSAGALWRPMIDPLGRFAIGWDGSLSRTDDPLGWAPVDGRLSLRTWTSDGDGGDAKGSGEGRVITDKAAGDFDARWDETGGWVAVWVGNEGDASVGRLTLFHLDADKQRLEHIHGAPDEEPALSGFSNGSGRLAWATPRGSNGEGSRVQIAAWSSSDVGVVASSPGEDVVVIR